MINLEEFNYLDKLEEKEEGKIIEIFKELNLENDINEQNSSDPYIKEKNKDFRYFKRKS